VAAIAEPPIRAELRIQTICLAILSVVIGGFALSWLQPVMIPFVVAVFLAFVLRPVVDWLEEHAGIPRTISVCVALLLAVGALVLIGFFAAVAVYQISSIATQYQKQLEDLLKWAANLLGHLGLNREQILDPFTNIPEGTVRDMLLLVTQFLWGIVSRGGIVLIFLFFLLLSSVKRDRPIGGAWGEMESRIRAYLFSMTLLSGVTGLLVGAMLAILGVPAAVLFGLLTFLLNFIPNVGSFISIILLLPVILLAPDFSPTHKVLAIGIPSIIQFSIGNFIQPKMMGESMNLHPVVILMALIFWGMLWGIVGAFLAVPITSIIRIACDRHALTRPIAKLMAGQLDSLRDDPVDILIDSTAKATGA
jgi:AI-2 transport protein TqsA